MTVTVTPTLTEVMNALGNLLLTIVPAGTQVVRGPVDRAAAPNVDYILMTPILRKRLRTNVVTDDSDASVATWEAGSSLHVQVDFFGDANSGDWCDTFTTLFRSDYAVDALAPTCAPLYADHGRQIPLVTGEEQYLERWMVTAVLQVNWQVSTPQDYADTLNITVISVDEAFPP